MCRDVGRGCQVCTSRVQGAENILCINLMVERVTARGVERNRIWNKQQQFAEESCVCF